MKSLILAVNFRVLGFKELYDLCLRVWGAGLIFRAWGFWGSEGSFKELGLEFRGFSVKSLEGSFKVFRVRGVESS